MDKTDDQDKLWGQGGIILFVSLFLFCWYIGHRLLSSITYINDHPTHLTFGRWAISPHYILATSTFMGKQPVSSVYVWLILLLIIMDGFFAVVRIGAKQREPSLVIVDDM